MMLARARAIEAIEASTRQCGSRISLRSGASVDR
jgi:hypothetical protein